MEIPVRAKVQYADVLGGEATHVIVRPAAKRITCLVVKERPGAPFGQRA
jgi:hypothetical protein